MTAKLQAALFGVLIVVTLVAGVVLSVVVDRIRVWRNARRRMS